jgi:hypothetical protein
MTISNLLWIGGRRRTIIWRGTSMLKMEFADSEDWNVVVVDG